MEQSPNPTVASKDLFLASFFDAKAYCCFKALQFYTKPENGGLSAAEIRADMPHYASQIHACFAKAHMDAWQHYLHFGAGEGINPSNDFDVQRYLTAKVEALTSIGSTKDNEPWTVASLEAELRAAHLSALEHFVRFAGRGPGEVPNGVTPEGGIPKEFAVPEDERVPELADEDIVRPIPARSPRAQVPPRNPKDFFSVGCYLQYKALHDFQSVAHGSLSEAQIRQNIFLYASEVWRIFQKAHVDPWIHYREYGTLEGINPSNEFDTVSYLQAKALALNTAGLTQDGKPWDAEAVARMLKRQHISALEHFLRYAGTGPGEVPEGLTEEGKIPECFAVPDVAHVAEVEIETLASAELPKERAQPPAEARPTAIEQMPELTMAVPARKPDWDVLVTGVREELWGKSLARRLIVLVVLVPGLLICCYLSFFASQSYISETRFAVRGQNTTQSFDGIRSLFSLPSATQSDSYIVANYILSLDMVQALDKKLHITEHYSDDKNDIWYRLTKNPKQDDLLDFWKWACSAAYDPDTSILEVQVKAFTPEMSLAICEGILENCEALVNAMNARARKDALHQAEAEVERAEARIRKAREALRTYREKTVVLDPEAVASGIYGLVNRLEGEVTKTAAELSEAMTYMSRGNPRVKQLENRLRVLERKLAEEKRRLAGKLREGQSLNDLLSGFQSLTLEEEFAQKQLTSAMASLEAARVRVDAQTQYVEAFERPALADESLYPRPFLFSGIYMITALLLLGLVSLIVAAVREHAGF